MADREKARQRLIEKLATFRKTLRGEERALFDEMIARTPEVEGHLLKEQKAGAKVGAKAGRPIAESYDESEVTGHLLKERPSAAKKDRPIAAIADDDEVTGHMVNPKVADAVKPKVSEKAAS